MADGRSSLVDGGLLAGCEAQDVEGNIYQHHLFVVINTIDCQTALVDEAIEGGVVADQTGGVHVLNGTAKDLVEDVVVSLGLLLEGYARLLEQVGLDVSAGNFARGTEVNSDEFSLKANEKSSYSYAAET